MVDLSFLEKFTKGNRTKMKKYVSMYLDMTPKTFEKMRENIENHSWQDLAVNAHSLKPQAEFMGIDELKEILISIEYQVKNNTFNNLKNLYEKSLHIHQESEILLQEFLNT